MYQVEFDCSNSFEVVGAAHIHRNSKFIGKDQYYQPENYLLQYFYEVDRQVMMGSEVYTLKKDTIMLSPIKVGYTAFKTEVETKAINIGFKLKEDAVAVDAECYQIPFVIELEPLHTIRSYFEEIVKCHSDGEGGNYNIIKASALLKVLLMSLSEVKPKMGSDDEITEVVAYIKEHWKDNIDIEFFLDDFEFSRSTFQRRFKVETGLSFKAFIKRAKMDMARQIMAAEPSILIRELSDMLGYCDEYYFSSVFKKYYGLAPSDYRKLGGYYAL